MPIRSCEKCGGRMSPRWPRARQPNGQMWCPSCVQAQDHVQTTAAVSDRHPDINWKVARFGVANTSLGRASFQLPFTTGATQDEQEQRLARPEGWDHSKTGFQPVRFAIEGARSYAHKLHLPDPHEHDYDQIHTNADTVRTIGRLYDKLPEHDPHAIPHFEAMRDEVGHQFHHLTHTMGVHVETTDHDPYANVHEMTKDVAENRRLKVLGTHATGAHPFFSNHENDQFRAVHDFFGHAATGRDFSRHGEEAAFRAHSRMFSEHARPAMTSETRGQNTSLILNGHFSPQKIALLPKQHWSVRRDAAGWSGEDVIRHELGRQKVHPVHIDGRHAADLCPQHLQMHRQNSDFAVGLAHQVGIHSGYPTIQAGPPREGRCTDCAQVSGTQSKERPWERREIPGAVPVRSDAQPTPSRWPHRPLREFVEEHTPLRPQIQSLNTRVALAHRMGQPGRMNGPGPIRVQAHDSGDGETIFHCPFCGSGQVLARSDGTVECEFCSTAFTVQVQPQMPAFPQTIDGVPVDVPGMPAGGANANVPPGAAPGADPGAEGDLEANDGPPGADDQDDGSDDGDDKPAFLKGSMLRTAAGRALPREHYMQHLALAHARNREAVLAMIREENGSR